MRMCGVDELVFMRGLGRGRVWEHAPLGASVPYLSEPGNPSLYEMVTATWARLGRPSVRV